jgi:hypothetical protein
MAGICEGLSCDESLICSTQPQAPVLTTISKTVARRTGPGREPSIHEFTFIKPISKGAFGYALAIWQAGYERCMA